MLFFWQIQKLIGRLTCKKWKELLTVHMTTVSLAVIPDHSCKFIFCFSFLDNSSIGGMILTRIRPGYWLGPCFMFHLVTKTTGWVKTRKLLILSEYVNKTEKVGGTWRNMHGYRENEAFHNIFTWNILHHNKCFMFKYSMTVLITQRSIRPLHKHDVIKSV